MDNNLFTVENGKLVYRGDLKVYGVLDASLIRTTELVTHQKYESQYLEFAAENGDNIGQGLLWTGGFRNKQLVFRPDPDRFFVTENLDLDNGKSFMINGEPVLKGGALGGGIVNSSLRSVGTLDSLAVAGKINFADYVYFNPSSQRFSIGTDSPSGLLTVYDNINDIEVIVDGDENGNAVLGTFNNRGLKFITDNQTRLSVSPNGDITLGLEQKDSTVTRIYGKVGIGVKNPVEQLEVAGNVRWANRLFAVGDREPENGHYQKGDIIWNSDPKPNGYVGWVCTASGNPGNWKAFGAISY